MSYCVVLLIVYYLITAHKYRCMVNTKNEDTIYNTHNTHLRDSLPNGGKDVILKVGIFQASSTVYSHCCGGHGRVCVVVGTHYVLYARVGQWE